MKLILQLRLLQLNIPLLAAQAANGKFH